jgi:tripartite-type tricarboxylate transporter receptor subunit TctC
LKTLGDAARKVAQDPEFRNVIDKAETEVAYLGADDFKKFWDHESVVLAQVIQRIGKVESR